MELNSDSRHARCEEFSMEMNFSWKLWKIRRYVVTLMGTMGFFTLYTLRGSLSVALVAMTQTVNVTHGNGTILQEREFNWDSRQRGLILGSFFYGYIWTQVLGGVLAARYGGHIVFGCGVGISAVLAILSLGAAKLGLYPLVCVRILMGLFQGVVFPSIQDIYANWAPKYERTSMMGIIQNGCQLGACISFLLSGYFVQYFGWESVFYIFGGFGTLWFLLWMIYIKRTPAADPRISTQEKAYIEANIELNTNHQNSISHTPWKKILTSRAVWAQYFPSACDAWISFTYITQIPSYLKDVLSYDIGTTGLLTAAPYMLYIITTPLFGLLSDWLRSRKILTTKSVRKLNTIIGFSLCALCLVIMCNSTNVATVLSCLIIAIGATGLTKISYFTNPQDLSPNYSAIIMGLSNTIATIPGIVAPTLSGFIVRNGTLNEWKIVFYISAGICIIGMTVFTLFGEGEVQEWAKAPQESAEDEANESLRK